MKKVRSGFIGIGGYGRFIMRLAKESGLADIVAVWNRTAAKAEKAAAEYGGRVYTSCEELYEDADLDAVFINLPPFAREGQEITAAEKRIHLYVTKPLTVDWDYACRVNSAVKKAGIISKEAIPSRRIRTSSTIRSLSSNTGTACAPRSTPTATRPSRSGACTSSERKERYARTCSAESSRSSASASARTRKTFLPEQRAATAAAMLKGKPPRAVLRAAPRRQRLPRQDPVF